MSATLLNGYSCKQMSIFHPKTYNEVAHILLATRPLVVVLEGACNLVVSACTCNEQNVFINVLASSDSYNQKKHEAK